ncbi:MAG: BREX system ATP-binding protein BrxD [Acidobacteria bacterium]|nr:BREX system ATP-binding protein BrxD [Acidobacteriota bacterium]MCB9398399.1 BREX system ATP-binding protein BrxD [Acidobacteriota bacterium]
MPNISDGRAKEILNALRRGTVPKRGLGALAVGLDRFAPTLLEELGLVKAGSSQFKALRGEYGSGKTFFSRWFQEQAQHLGFATSEIQISETETPLHHLETVYRRFMEQMATRELEHGAFRGLLDAWLFDVEETVSQGSDTDDSAFESAVAQAVEKRLKSISDFAPLFAAGVRGYHRALLEQKDDVAEGLAAWLAGQPNVSASVKRFAGLKGDIDHFGALTFLQGLLALLKDLGYAGLVVVLDEVETLQRFRRDGREKSLNALRQWLDELDKGRFPNLYVLITGTAAFFDGPKGIRGLPPLAQRLQTDFQTEARFDNPRAVQIRLSGFDLNRLIEVGVRVRHLFAQVSAHPDRIEQLANDDLLQRLARAITGELGGQAGVAPRLFLKKWVAEVLDRVDQFPDFDPNTHYQLTVANHELSAQESAARAGNPLDDIDLEL